MTSVMQSMRLETRPQHVELERTVDLKSRFESLDGYIDLLQKMLGLHEPLEASLLRLDWSGTSVDLPRRRKTAWLETDLLALGGSERDIAALPRCMQLPGLDNPARAIGCLYVLEGSTLGGNVIARQLTKTLGIGTATGGRFYASYGDRLGVMWSAFGAAAEQCCDTDAARGHALDAARETFECFEHWFRDGGSKRRARSTATPLKRSPGSAA